jgi:hypothetical protein
MKTFFFFPHLFGAFKRNAQLCSVKQLRAISYRRASVNALTKFRAFFYAHTRKKAAAYPVTPLRFGAECCNCLTTRDMAAVSLPKSQTVTVMNLHSLKEFVYPDDCRLRTRADVFHALAGFFLLLTVACWPFVIPCAICVLIAEKGGSPC